MSIVFRLRRIIGCLFSVTKHCRASSLVGAGVCSLMLASQVATAGVAVSVDPGGYSGTWAHNEPGGPNFAAGARIIDVEPGFNFMFIGGIGGFSFNVAADGTVTTGPVSATGGVGTLTFNSVSVDIDPADFVGEWVVSRVTSATTGLLAVPFVPGIDYLMFVGGGNNARFNFNVDSGGNVALISNTEAGIGSAGTLRFNTSEVFVDPGTYVGSWQIPGVSTTPVLQTTGSASTQLVTGVSYVVIPDRAGLSFPVTEPCSLVELDFVDFIFTVGCSSTVHECAGFDAPLNKVVKVRNHRALPLKATLLDEFGLVVADTDISAPPVIKVLFSPDSGGAAVDVTDDVLPVGQSSSGNVFSFDSDTQRWLFNLSTENYSANGTYSISMETGDPAEYAIDPGCVATFVIQ